MKLNVHYECEGKTWSQGLCHKVYIGDMGSIFFADRKPLEYGIKPA